MSNKHEPEFLVYVGSNRPVNQLLWRFSPKEIAIIDFELQWMLNIIEPSKKTWASPTGEAQIQEH